MDEKLTKAKLYKKIHKPFLEMGYLEFACKNLWYGIYVKNVAEGWYLTVGPVIHRFYDDLFTTDMWLSKNTLINRANMPWDSSFRPENILKCDWWEGLPQESVDDFLTKFRNICEPKVISQISVIAEILEANKYVSEVAQLNTGVYNKYVELFGDPSESFDNFNLQKPIKTPDSWYMASEKYFEKNGSQNFSSGKIADTTFVQWITREYALRMKNESLTENRQ